MTTPAAVVTFDLWTVPRRRIPAALTRMATDRRELRGRPGLTFAKLLGTGTGRTFTPRDADPTRWALLGAWDSAESARAFEGSRVRRGWARLATQHWHVEMRPLTSKGRWSRQAPFDPPPFDPPPARSDGAGKSDWTGPVAAVTRARLNPRAALSFWRAVPPVAADLAGRPGLRLAVGIGEAPIGLQGTFSLWDDARSLRAFAYERPAHLAVVRETARRGWYAEELFARFAVLSAHGTVAGRNPIAPMGQSDQAD